MSNQPGVAGFVYASDEAPGPMAGARVEDTVGTASLEPPWIVVDHTVERVIVTRWPGRLFRVVSVPPRTAEERAATARAADGLVPNAGYTPSFAVEVLAELDPTILFGPHGAAVADVIAVGRSPTVDLARRLTDAAHPDAGEAYGRAWDAWLSARDDARTSPLGSPVNGGFSVLSTVVNASAQRYCAWYVDGDGEHALTEPWESASRALLYAAMALGAPHLMSATDAAVLTATWQAVSGGGTAGDPT